MNALTGIYSEWLRMVGGTGDVITESRGKREDRELKRDFQAFMTEGDGLPDVRECRRPVSSSQIKLNLKTDNITGLQLADLLAYPSKWGILLDDEPQGYRISSATVRFIESVRPLSNRRNTLLS